MQIPGDLHGPPALVGTPAGEQARGRAIGLQALDRPVSSGFVDKGHSPGCVAGGHEPQPGEKTRDEPRLLGGFEEVATEGEGGVGEVRPDLARALQMPATRFAPGAGGAGPPSAREQASNLDFRAAEVVERHGIVGVRVEPRLGEGRRSLQRGFDGVVVAGVARVEGRPPPHRRDGPVGAGGMVRSDLGKAREGSVGLAPVAFEQLADAGEDPGLDFGFDGIRGGCRRRGGDEQCRARGRAREPSKALSGGRAPRGIVPLRPGRSGPVGWDQDR